MKNKFLSLFIFLVLSCSIHAFSESELYDDSYNVNQKRVLFGKAHIHETTGGKIDFEYDPAKGVYCKASEDIYSKEFVFKVPEKYILCSPDIFPFQFELKDSIYSIISKKHNFNETKALTGAFLMSYHLMLLLYANRTAIFDEVVRLNENYYNVPPTNDLLEYIETLPRSIYSRDVYKRDDILLLEMLGLLFQKIPNDRELYEQVLMLMKRSVGEETFSIIKPWLSNWEMFRYCVGLLSVRTFRISFYDYLNLRNATVDDEPGASLQRNLHNEIYKDGPLLCMIPFTDLCNHRRINRRDKEPTDFVIKIEKGIAKFAVYTAFHKGDDYEFAYIADSSNLNLLTTYGFYLDNNPDSQALMSVQLIKSKFTRAKNNLCKKLKCFEADFDHFYDSKEESANILVKLSPNEILKAVIYYTKLNLLSNEEFTSKEKEISRRMKRDQWIDYNNELITYSLIREILQINMNQYALSYEDIVYAIHNTRKYYKDNREMINKNNFLRFKYRLKRRMMMVGKESKWIFMKNLHFAQKKIAEIQNDQFRKLRNFFVESNSYFE